MWDTRTCCGPSRFGKKLHIAASLLRFYPRRTRRQRQYNLYYLLRRYLPPGPPPYGYIRDIYFYIICTHVLCVYCIMIYGRATHSRWNDTFRVAIEWGFTMQVSDDPIFRMELCVRHKTRSERNNRLPEVLASLSWVELIYRKSLESSVNS